MTRYVVDTNVPIVANGRPDPQDQRPPKVECRIAAITFLQEVLRKGKILVDLNGKIQTEYNTYLNAQGQPGVGDRFYQEVLNSSPQRIERVELPLRPDGEYLHLPQPIIDANFDPSDRKFAALGIKEDAEVSNATDSDWVIHREVLANCGVRINFVCGCDTNRWFVEGG